MTPLTIRPAGWDETREKVRSIPQYRNCPGVTIATARLPPEGLSPLCLLVRAYRLAAVEELVAAYRRHHLELFQGAWLAANGGPAFLLPPPVVEVHEGRRVIIDGLHRVYHALRLGVAGIEVAVVAGVQEPLPADVLEWSDVTLTHQHTSRGDKFRHLDEARFRDVRRWIDERSG